MATANWDELLCGSDMDSAESLPADLDGDGTCNGKDSDADGDGFVNNTGASGDDCNDLDPMIHPHSTDENGAVEDFNYDVTNGIDDDCDGSIDETATGCGTATPLSKTRRLSRRTGWRRLHALPATATTTT